MTNDQNESQVRDEEPLVADESLGGSGDNGEPEPQPTATDEVAEVSLDPEAMLSEAEAKAAEYLDGWQRARAELANAKKRMDKERGQLRESVKADIILRLLPLFDDLDLAMENVPEELDANEWVDGIRLIHRKLQEQLTALGLSEIEALGAPFDPERHEAVMQVEQDGQEVGTIVAVMRKGYQLDERVIRPAMVQVAG